MRETYLDMSSALKKKMHKYVISFCLSKESNTLLSSCYLWYVRQCIDTFKLTEYDTQTH